MEKTVAANPRRENNKQTKSKKKKQQQQPLKVVYITNPMKFEATVSEFRALVQELTGQDADVSNSSSFAAAYSGAAKSASAEGNAHTAEEVGLGGSGVAPRKGACEDDGFCSLEMMVDNYQASDMWHGGVRMDYDFCKFT